MDDYLIMTNKIIDKAARIARTNRKDIDAAIQKAANDEHVNIDDYDIEHIWKAVYYAVTPEV
jgi:hypothetical protein